MNHWQILNINPTQNIKTIKQAYAKLLRSNNPEDRPESFQLIKEAYQAALNEANQKDENKKALILLNKPLHYKNKIQNKLISITATEKNSSEQKINTQSIVNAIFKLCDNNKQTSAIKLFRHTLKSEQYYGIDPLYELEGKLLIGFYQRSQPPIKLLLTVNEIFNWDKFSNPFKYDHNYSYAFDKVILLIEGAKKNDCYHFDRLKFKYFFYSAHPDEKQYLWKYIESALYKEANIVQLTNIYNAKSTRDLFQQVIEFAKSIQNTFTTPPITQSVQDWWQQKMIKQNTVDKINHDLKKTKRLKKIFMRSTFVFLIIVILSALTD